MPKWVRLWGKKRGSRMSGWWVVGSAGEAAFFGSLFLLGILSLTTVVTWQLFWPKTTLLPVYFGFWLMVIAASSFIVIGLTGFLLQVSQTLASPELRSAIAGKAKQDHRRRADNEMREPHLPGLRELTDSPGVKLKYRLAVQNEETSPIVLITLFSGAWNTLLTVLVVIAVQNHLSGAADWFLTGILLPFLAVSYVSTSWFFRLFRTRVGIGPTAVEICELPLLPGKEYRLYLCQYGRARFERLELHLVGYEESIYKQGTDVRTEQAEIARLRVAFTPESQKLFEAGLKAEAESPLELHCTLRLPLDIMHSFQGQNNAVSWKIVVEGVAEKWPSFCRRFPVVVYPCGATLPVVP